MKNLILLALLSLGYTVNAQIVHNSHLQAQTKANYITRISSNYLHAEEFRELNDIHSEIDKNLLQVMYVKDKVFETLKNVESAMRNGKQIIYITKYSALAIDEFTELTTHNLVSYPDVLAFRNDYVTKYLTDALALVTEINAEILKADHTYLMNYRDRQQGLNRIQSRVYQLYIRTKGFNRMISNYRRLKFLFRIKPLNDYYNKDRMLFLSIMRNIDRL